MWLEGLLGDTDLLRLIKRYFAWFVVNLKSAQRQHKYENRPEIQMPCMQYFSANTGLRCKTYVFLFLVSGCKTWHCCTNDLMPTNDNPPVTMTKKCLIIHICFRWRTTHQPYASKTLNAFSPTSEPSLKTDPWYLAPVCFSKWKLWKLRHRRRLFTIVLYYSVFYYLFCTIVLNKYWTYTCDHHLHCMSYLHPRVRNAQNIQIICRDLIFWGK